MTINQLTRRYLLQGASTLGLAAGLTKLAQAKTVFFGVEHVVNPGGTVDFVADFGAVPGGGAGSSDAAVTAFNTWFATATGDVTLTIPAGTYNITDLTSQWFARLNSTADSLTIQGSGSGSTIFSTGVGFGSNGVYEDNAHSARLASVPAGSTTVTLNTLADHSLWAVGDWALITGLDLQGYGYPSNPQWHEYVQITAIDTGTGVITFSAPLVNTYLSTWPLYAPGAFNAMDQGGPATLYAINQTWNLELIVTGCAFNGTSSQQYSKLRHVEYHNCTWGSGSPGPTPTENLYYLLSGCTILSTGLEPDKLVETLDIVSTTLHNIGFQSSSIKDVFVTGCTINNLQGNGGGDTIVTNTNCAFMSISPYAYGACLGTHTFTNLTVPQFDNPQGLTGATYNTNLYTHAGGGVFTIAKSDGPQGWAVPGARIGVNGSNGQITQFTVLGVAESGANTVITTDLGGAFPSAPTGWGATVLISARATNRVYASGCSGNNQIVNMNQTGAQGLPLNSYWLATYTQANFPAASFPLVGRMFTISFNVTTAFAGTANPLRLSPDQFHVFGTTGTYAAYDFLPGISLRTAGNRVYYPQGVSGAVGADNNAPTATSIAWISSGMQPFLSGSSSGGTFSITIEAVCDQSALNANGTLQVSGMFSQGTTAVAPLNYYTPGTEGPAVSTADYYHIHACQFLRPIDLDACGTKGAAVKAANGGNRYAWISSAEHPEGGTGIWRDSWSFMIGFSNDPGIFPDVMYNSIPSTNLYTGSVSTPGANGYTLSADFAPTTLLYNADDAANPFYLFCQIYLPTAFVGTQGGVFKSSNLFDWALAAWGPKNIDEANIPGFPLTSFQTVQKIGTGNWVSHGEVADIGSVGPGKWTSSDGLTWIAPNFSSYNRGAYPLLNFALSGTALTAASSIFTSADVGKGILVSDTAGNALTLNHTIAAYVSGTQVTLDANLVGLSFAASHAPVQYGPVFTQTAHAPDGTGGINVFNGNSTIPVTFSGNPQYYRAVIEDARHSLQSTDDGMWVTMSPIDSDFNVSQYKPGIHVSSQYAGFYPGPTYLISMAQYAEDGILHLYAEAGYAGPHGTTTLPYVGASVTGSISGATLTVTAVNGAGNITLGAYVFYSASASIGFITAFGSGSGGTGTYTITNPGSVSAPGGSSIDINGGAYGDRSSSSIGGLNEQFVDYYTVTLDFATAAQAAPFGVAASCSSNTVTISWKTHVTGYDPWGISYNVYRGTTVGTQATLVGNSTSTSITDTPTPGSVYYYRVVKKSLGIEYPTKYRIVSTYVG